MQIKKAVMAVALAGAAVVGGVVGSTMLGTANAATTSSSGTATSGTPAQPAAGGWHSNTDPAHEAAESPARAAAEKASDASGVPPQ